MAKASKKAAKKSAPKKAAKKAPAKAAKKAAPKKAAKKAAPKKAAKKAAISRFRPILMTSLAMIFGALPIAMTVNSRQSLGIVIVGGLLFAGILTLFVIPAVYSYLSSSRKKKAIDTAQMVAA